MKQKIREIEPHVILYRDYRNGLAWIHDGRHGIGISVHANIDATGSVAGMKLRGFWRKNDRIVRSHGFIYNVDTFLCRPDDELEMIVADECLCIGCAERRMKEGASNGV